MKIQLFVYENSAILYEIQLSVYEIQLFFLN